ncbi:hypothetical protein FraEuI1c_6994 [Pseudofrankia inefficax]|uniref:Uncharacterized protein n=2 Tax=Pseudofrankia inefficax (strain DSM 45817 / CECT 9037 / DDB 130130 / EuI1c) TaxID=298654 RepID=E3IW33_PSEI1|nr:hypothetical protein FraEuI1c_6994 [Pseudofrankia inefficax]
MIVLGIEAGSVDVATAAALLAWAAVTAVVALTRFGIRRELRHEGRPVAAGPEPALAAALVAEPAAVPSTAVATIVLDLARRGLVDIWRDDRFGVLVQARPERARSAGLGPTPAWSNRVEQAGDGPADGAGDPPLAVHEIAVLRLVTVRTTPGPLPAGALFQEAAPSPALWRDELVAEAERAATRFQTPRRRRVRHLTTASVFLILAASMLAGFTASRRFVKPEIETEGSINSPAEQWFFVFFLVLLATVTISMIVTGGARKEDDGRRRGRWRRASSGLAADPDLAAAGPEAISVLGHRLVYAAALGHAPAAVEPFTPDESPAATAWTARSGTPRPIVIRLDPAIDTDTHGGPRGAGSDGVVHGRRGYDGGFGDPPGERLAVGEVVRARRTPAGAWWIAVHDGASNYAVARRIELNDADRAPGVGAIVRLARDADARTWSVDVLEPAAAQAVVAARPDPTALLDIADLRQVFPGSQIEALPPTLRQIRIFRVRRAGSPKLTIQCLVFTAGPLRTLLMARSRRRRLPVPGEVYLRGRVRAVILVGDLAVAVDITGRHVENRRDLLTALARVVVARLGVPVGNPAPRPPARL